MRWSNNTLVPSRRDESWSFQIRSYVIGRGVKDLRTGIEHGFDDAMNGDIDCFLKAALAQRCGRVRSRSAPVPE